MSNRKELIERWQRIATETKEPTMYRLDSPDSKMWMADFLIETAEASIEALSDQWIPVSERLPEYSELVLVYSPGFSPEVDYLKTSNKFTVEHVAESHHVTHWQPLPAPPED